MRQGKSALSALLATCLVGCGTAAGGVRVEGHAPTTMPWSGPVYMNDAGSVPRQHPDLVDLTVNTTLDRLVWLGWGPSRAEPDGIAVDFACVSGCPGDDLLSYPVHLVLDGLVRRQYAAYYGHAVLTPEGEPAPYWALDVGDVSLRVPKA